jgi:hypothetical protein
MKVFVSHKDSDADLARGVFRVLDARGVSAYLDELDDRLLRGPQLADHLRSRMATCSHLIAVVSSSTAKSWWVPWEIGVASERTMPLASFTSTPALLPEYLLSWPYMSRESDINAYVDEAQRFDRETKSLTASGARSADWQGFHNRLKTRLGQ